MEVAIMIDRITNLMHNALNLAPTDLTFDTFAVYGAAHITHLSLIPVL
jgi:hypothetical protein